jgi:hypothetical protein
MSDMSYIQPIEITSLSQANGISQTFLNDFNKVDIMFIIISSVKLLHKWLVAVAAGGIDVDVDSLARRNNGILNEA